MKNAEKFRKIFKEFATEVWAFPEKDFLTWLNAEYEEPTTKNNLGVDREDAVERLNALKQLIGYDKDSEIVKATQKSLDMAIKALEQVPTTKNNLGVDCVARQDVERYIEGFINEYTPKEELEFINLELDGLKHLPSVTPQEPILDKIRAEIESLKRFEIRGEVTPLVNVDRVLGIIDKAETEGI